LNPASVNRIAVSIRNPIKPLCGFITFRSAIIKIDPHKSLNIRTARIATDWPMMMAVKGWPSYFVLMLSQLVPNHTTGL